MNNTLGVTEIQELLNAVKYVVDLADRALGDDPELRELIDTVRDVQDLRRIVENTVVDWDATKPRNGSPQAVQLLRSETRGQYIPKQFAEEIVGDNAKGIWSNIKQDDLDILCNGPEHPHYWEAWDAVLCNAKATIAGYTFTLYQDGDLWALCDELMSTEERERWCI